MDFIQNLSVPSLYPIVSHLTLYFNLNTPPSYVLTTSYNNREQSHPLSVFSTKELRFGSDAGVNATHHSVVNKDPVHLHSLTAFTVDRVNTYFHPIKFKL